MEFDLNKEELRVLERLLGRGGKNLPEDILVTSFLDNLRHCMEVGCTLHINPR